MESGYRQIVDTRDNTVILFCIGGDGTLRGAHDIHKQRDNEEEIKLPLPVF
ncbi:MAG: hypothetical protein U0X39_14695 [Bacteroidales bacterium]